MVLYTSKLSTPEPVPPQPTIEQTPIPPAIDPQPKAKPRRPKTSNVSEPQGGSVEVIEGVIEGVIESGNGERIEVQSSKPKVKRELSDKQVAALERRKLLKLVLFSVNE